MFSAQKMAAIDSPYESAAAKYVVGQSARMMERNCNMSKLQRNAVEVILAFSDPSPQKTTGVPSRRDRARALGVPPSTLDRVDARLIEKRRQLTTAGETGVHWALSKRKKGFSKIDEALRLLLVDAFNDHPHVIVSPNSKDTLQHKNEDGEIVLVQKVLTQVGLGSIFSNNVCEHPTIKNRVRERAFCYIISGLGCVRCFTDSYKQMCGCTECAGLHSLHRSLFAAGQARGNASQICDQFPAWYNKGTCLGDGKGVGSSWVAYQAIARYHEGHLHAMDIACCAALGVQDTPV